MYQYIFLVGASAPRTFRFIKAGVFVLILGQMCIHGDDGVQDSGLCPYTVSSTVIRQAMCPGGLVQ
jgi:hypothetical protein